MTANAMLKPNVADLEALDRAYMFHPSTHLKNHAHGARPAGSCGAARASASPIATAARAWTPSPACTASTSATAAARSPMRSTGRCRSSPITTPMSAIGSEPAIELSQRIIELAPAGMRRVYYGLSGSDANETQIKLVWYYNNVLGPAREEEDHRARARLPRLGPDDRQPDRPAAVPQGVRPAVPQVRHTMCPHYWKYATEGESERDFSPGAAPRSSSA